MASAICLLTWSAIADPLRQLVRPPERSLPTFTLRDLNGASVDLAGLRGSSVVIHFFATWCEPCRAEFASLAQLAAKRPSLTILAVNVAEVPTRVRRFAEAEGIALPILLDADRKVTRSWSVVTLPTTFILDDTHTARLFVEGDLDWSRPDILAAMDAATAPTLRAPHPTRPIKGRNE